MNRLTAMAAAAMTLLVAPAAAQAPDGGPDNVKGRYALSPVDGGILKLDKESGAVSLCSKKGDAWSCDPVADGSKADGERARLEAENRQLRDRITALEQQAPGGPEPPAPKAQLPTEEEVDKALDYVENIFKKFRDRIRKYEGSAPELPAPAEPDPADPGKDGKAL